MDIRSGWYIRCRDELHSVVSYVCCNFNVMNIFAGRGSDRRVTVRWGMRNWEFLYELFMKAWKKLTCEKSVPRVIFALACLSFVGTLGQTWCYHSDFIFNTFPAIYLTLDLCIGNRPRIVVCKFQSVRHFITKITAKFTLFTERTSYMDSKWFSYYIANEEIYFVPNYLIIVRKKSWYCS